MSRFSIITPPVLDPVSLLEAKAHCRLDGDCDQGLLAGYILAARSYVESVTGRSLINRTCELKLDSDWAQCGDSDKIILRAPPFVSTTSITYVDTSGVSQALAANQYQSVVGDIYGYIVPAYGVAWPTVRDQPDAITVTYVAGYGDQPGHVPHEIRQAILLMVGHFYEHRESANTPQMHELPLAVESLLNQYLTYP